MSHAVGVVKVRLRHRGWGVRKKQIGNMGMWLRIVWQLELLWRTRVLGEARHQWQQREKDRNSPERSAHQHSCFIFDQVLRKSVFHPRHGAENLFRLQTGRYQMILADLAVTKNDVPLGVLRNILLVSDQDDGQTLLLVQPLEDLHHLDRGAAIKIAGRLIRQQDRGAVHQRTRDGYTLLLT